MSKIILSKFPNFSTVLIKHLFMKLTRINNNTISRRNKRKKNFSFGRCAKIKRCAKLPFLGERKNLGHEN